MSKTIQKPRECRNAHCGAMCCPIQVEEMQIMWGGNPNKCPYYERRDDLYMDKAIPLDKVKQERERQYSKGTQALYNEKYLYAVKVLDKLIEESEGK